MVPRKKVGTPITVPVLKIIKEYGAVNRKIIFKELWPELYGNGNSFSKLKEYEKLNSVLKKLKKRGTVHLSQGYYSPGSKVGTPRGGVKDGTRNVGFAETPNASMYRWIKEPYFYHAVQGKINFTEVGTLPGPNFSGEFPIDGMPSSAYVKILRQHTSLQFWFSYHRPGFSKYELLVAFQTLYAWMAKNGVIGEVVIQQFEVRNERNDVVHYLRRIQNPVSVKLIEGLFAEAYYDKEADKTNFEFKGIVEWSPAQFLNTVNNMGVAANSMGVVESLGSVTNGIHRKIEVLNNSMVDAHDRTIGFSIEAQEEIRKVVDELEFAGTTQETVGSYLETILLSVNELKGKDGIGGASQESFQDLSAFQDPKVAEAFNVLSQNVIKLTELVNETRNEVVELREEQKKWRDLDDQARLETIHEYRVLSQSWQYIGDQMGHNKGVIWKFHNENCSCERNDVSAQETGRNGGNGGVIPTFTKMVPTNGTKNHQVFLKNEFEIDISMTQKQQVLQVFEKIGAAFAQDVINYLPHIRESSVRRALTDLKNEDELSVIREGQGKKRRNKYVRRKLI